MFDIGFWEIVMVGVVALLVIGPKELPTMMRTVGRWTGKTRHFVNAVKTEIEREAYRADELKRLLVEQAEIVERHKKIDPAQPAIPVSHPDYKGSQAASVPSSVMMPAASATTVPVHQTDAMSKTSS